MTAILETGVGSGLVSVACWRVGCGEQRHAETKMRNFIDMGDREHEKSIGALPLRFGLLDGG